MAAKAELKVTADANIRPFKAKMQEAKREGINVSEEIAQKNKEAVSSLLDYASPVMMLIAAVGALGTAFSKMADRGDELRKSARELGVSVGTMSELNARAKAANKPLEEMNDLFAQLKEGKITLEQLREAMGGFGDKARYSAEMMRNLTAIQVSKSRERLSGIGERFSGWTTEMALRMGSWSHASRVGNVYRPYIESAAESGQSEFEIWKNFSKKYNWATGDRATDKEYASEIKALIASAVSMNRTSRAKEQAESENKVMQNLLKEIGDLDEAVLQYNENFGKNVSREEFERRSKPAEESAYQKSVRLGKENLKAQEAEKKAAEEESKREKERAKIEIGYAYTKGGGMLAGLNYGLGMRNAEESARAKDSQNLKTAADGIREMKNEVEKTNKILEGE